MNHITTDAKNVQINMRKKYRESNNIVIKEKQKKWYDEKENKESINAREKNKYKNDRQYRIKKILKSRFKKTVLKKKKYSSILTYIGVDLEYFLKWIEYQFDEHMSWDN